MAKRGAGRWKPGVSGNPKGRPPGTGAVGKLRMGIAKQLPGILEKLVEQATAGDTSAARLLLERTVAPLRATDLPEPVSLGDGTPSEQCRAVLAAVAAGEVSVSQGAALLGAIGALSKVIEVDELVARVAALEGKNGD